MLTLINLTIILLQKAITMMTLVYKEVLPWTVSGFTAAT